MMWLLVAAWIAFLFAAAIAAQQILGFNLDEAPKLFAALPLPQQAMIGVAAALALFVAVVSVLQSSRSARRSRDVKDLETSLADVRIALTEVREDQASFDAAGEHLSKNEPEQAVSSLLTRLTGAEQRTAFQQSRNESVDLRERLDDIQRRQHALRKQIGEVSATRRTIEPIFGELKQRQMQLEESLAEVETDDKNNSLGGRLKEVSGNVMQIQSRLKALEESWDTLNRFKDELGTSKTQLVRLQAPEEGLAAMIDDLRGRRDQMTKTLDGLESHDDQKLGAHVEALSKGKIDTAQRIGRLDECFVTLNAIRTEFAELEERRAHLERSLGEVETDPTGKSLADRQKALDEFAAQTRVRVRVLQDSSTALNGFRQDIDKSQAALAPLQSSVDGIEAPICTGVAIG
jgi:chromosome segregation ATPase